MGGVSSSARHITGHLPQQPCRVRLCALKRRHLLACRAHEHKASQAGALALDVRPMTRHQLCTYFVHGLPGDMPRTVPSVALSIRLKSVK